MKSKNLPSYQKNCLPILIQNQYNKVGPLENFKFLN